MNKDAVSPYKMNLPTDLKTRLQEAADRSGRSLSSEIITRLQASVSLADDNGLDFTYEAFEKFVFEIVDRGTEDIRAKLREVEYIATGRDMNVEK